MAFDTLAVRRDGGVLHLTLNRPELRNAMSLAMVGELREALRDAEADATTRIVVLRGAGGHFCAGADLKDLAAARAANADALAETNTRFGARFAAPESLVHEAADVFARAALGSEGLEGTMAFLQKRKPHWAPQ